jgi:CYTH domain
VRAEQELKFVVGRDTLRTALTIPLPGEMTHGPVSPALKSTYFDTETLELKRRGVSLRVRQSGGHCILGVKKDAHAHGGYFERDEEEALLPSSEVSTSSTVGSPPSYGRSLVRKRSSRDLAQTFVEPLRRSGSMAQISKSPSMKAFSSPASGGSRLMKSIGASSRPMAS